MKNPKLAFSFGAFTILTLVFLMASPFVQARTSADQKSDKDSHEGTSTVFKSYSLKYVDAYEVYMRVQLIIFRGEVVGNVLNVVVPKNKVQELDELVKRLDVEKKRILFRIYTVLASRKAPNDASLKAVRMAASIDNPELKPVLDELKGLWNFKSYRVDSPSFLTAKDDSGPNFMRLLSEWPRYNLTLLHPQIRGEESGKRIIFIGQIQLKEPAAENSRESTIIDAEDINLKEKGWLVVGVGGMPMGTAVILIISAEIIRPVPVPTVMPCEGLLAGVFGEGLNPFTGKKTQNNGIDIATANNTEIKAIWDGDVFSIEREHNYGFRIRVHHNLGYETFYSSLGRLRIKEGSRVKAGDVLGIIENSGSKGQLFHLEIHQNGEPQNPIDFLKELIH